MKKVFLISVAFIGISMTSCVKFGWHSNETISVLPNKSEIVNENILARRSVRKYKPVQVSKDTIDLIIKAGINAPSAMNLQPWQVRVVRNKDILAKIAAGARYYDSPTLIVVACDTANHYGMFDAGLFSQNVMLAAEGFDLGTCAIGGVAHFFDRHTPESDTVLQSLNFPQGYRVVLGISLGYKDERPQARERNADKVKYVE